MEVITISGRLLEDCELCTDKRGNSFVRFKVTCKNKDYNGKTIYNVYRCICYYAGFEDLKRNEKVYIVGDLSLSIRKDQNGESWINADVYVRHIDRNH